ncbi:BTAD domain-containing putative transcriptional regulator [Mycolicibacterium mucogenicum]|uniref:AAA family ATPase n=1 Tax=Mycolicibacterium mucogenicum DSM 44124 TaxID=1226753 RepID=A0A8H2JG56_MYCMU|nr:BTAD domain-containing putative transcriptional regulator [Mycolicibacterium mucogenicum]QPG68766.1 AAA family ATPase [Mycolicibacterium mucogenicum DSM 44124]
MELGVLGPLQVRRDGTPVTIPGAKPRAILTMLGLHCGSVVSADAFFELLWGDESPRTAAKALQTHISALRRVLGDGLILTEGAGWTLAESEVDAARYKSAARSARDAVATGDIVEAVVRFDEAVALWRGIPELPDGRRGTSEKTRWIESHAALVEDRADALLAAGRVAEIIGELEAAVAEAPLRERRWGQLMLALYRAGRQGEALGAYRRARALLADELGVDPGPGLRRLEAAIVAQDGSLEVPAVQHVPSVTRAVTFLLTDIEGSTAAWETDADAMAVALARHDELVGQIVTSHGGRLIKTRGEGDATFSVFDRPSAAAAAAIELQQAMAAEGWALVDPMRIRVALHTGEAELRDGDYFGRAVNRAARLRSIAEGGQILCSGATAELVIDSLSDDVALADLGMRQLKNLARPEHVFELRRDVTDDTPEPPTTETSIERPALPAVLTGSGPFVGRGVELERLFTAWQTALAGTANSVLIAGEPGVGKTRLAGEWSRQAYDQGALVIYGRCDEDLGAPYQPFAEALRALVPCLGADRLRGLRGVEALLALVPGLADVLPDVAAPTRADPDTERYALFDAVVAVMGVASASTPVVLILDDLHWAAKPTLLLLRHLLRFGDHARVQIVGTYRSTDLDRSHPLAAMLADLNRDGTASRLSLSGLDVNEVTAYVAETGYDDEELARALASVTGGNPFFLIEALRHVEESGGHWDPSTLPQGVREAVSRRLSRLPAETNKALAAAAVIGSRFHVNLVEKVVGGDLIDAFDEACHAGIVIEEPGGCYRFNHAIVRQSLLAELPSVRRMRLHQRIAVTLEDQPGADDELFGELAHHYFECAWAGNAAKAIEYCRLAADQAMTRLAYEGAADLYDHALHALEELDDEVADRDDQVADLLIARCEALLAAGDVASAADVVPQLHSATVDSPRLAAWATCFAGQLSMLTHPDRLDEIESALYGAARKLGELNDAAGEAKAHTVRAACLARLGRIGDSEVALDEALTAARRSGDHRRVNAVLAGAPLAALWGPNPVPRAGGRCLDVVRLLRITTESPAVEATSMRCQAVLEAFRGRSAAARRMIDSARRTVTGLGLRHAGLEVEHYAGIIELVSGDAVAAELFLRKAYNGFRRLRLDLDIAETAALLGRTCLMLGRVVEADELCTESERRAGHALKSSIAWRTLRAQLLSCCGEHAEARKMAEAAVALAQRTDALVDHGDACDCLAGVLKAAGDTAGARAAAERAAGLYERKGAAVLAERARGLLDDPGRPSAPAEPEPPTVGVRTAAVLLSERVMAAHDRADWDEFERLVAPDASVESRRKLVGFKRGDFTLPEVTRQTRRDLESGAMRVAHDVIAVRGECLALARVRVGTADVSAGAPQDEFLQVYGVDSEGRVIFQVWFDPEDMDAAIAELDARYARPEERSRKRRRDNAATHVAKHYLSYFADRDWNAVATVLADDLVVDDRRRVVNAGIRHGRGSEIQSLQAYADAGITHMNFVVVATRRERLALVSASGAGGDSGEFRNELLGVVETNSHNQIAAMVVFDPDDLDAATAELDARYLAGEAAPHAHTWSTVLRAYDALNRHELPDTTVDMVSIDNRLIASFVPGGIKEYTVLAWEQVPDISFRIESVHLLTDSGTVITQVLRGTSRDGFEAEWREIHLMTLDGELFSRSEMFDETDLGAALARFTELDSQVRPLENAASRLYERYFRCFATRDWATMAEMYAEVPVLDDRRAVIGTGVLSGLEAVSANMRAVAEFAVTLSASSVIATRGQRLALVLSRFASNIEVAEPFYANMLTLAEIDVAERITAFVTFDSDDLDAAVAELDARYLAGEAAPFAHTWSVITNSYAEFNRHEIPRTTTDPVYVDHRALVGAEGADLAASLAATLELVPDARVCVEVVHRLNELGAVITQSLKGTSAEGGCAELWMIDVITVEGELTSGVEIFDETDLDAALARFDELCRPVPRLENATAQRFVTAFANRDWETVAYLFAEDYYCDDRRRVVNAGVRNGPDAAVQDLRIAAEVGLVADVVLTTLASRGARLTAYRLRASGKETDDIQVDLLQVVEVDAEERVAAVVVFDLDDSDAAFEELDSRYLAGEAAAYSRTWSVIAEVYATASRGEIPETTTGFVGIDHRPLSVIGAGELKPFLLASFADSKHVGAYIDTVHRLTESGAVITQVAKSTSQADLTAEWRLTCIYLVDGDLLSRCELFDPADLEAALARFDELTCGRT